MSVDLHALDDIDRRHTELLADLDALDQQILVVLEQHTATKAKGTRSN